MGHHNDAVCDSCHNYNVFTALTLQLKGLITFATGQHRAAEQLSVLVSALTPAPLPQPLVTGLGYMRQALAEVNSLLRVSPRNSCRDLLFDNISSCRRLSITMRSLEPVSVRDFIVNHGQLCACLVFAHVGHSVNAETVAVAADYTVQLNVGGQYSKSVIAAAVQALQPAQPANSIPGYRSVTSNVLFALLIEYLHSPHSALLGDEEVFADAPGFRNLAGVPCTVNSSVSVTVYNSLGWDVTQFVQMSTNCSNIASVVDASTGRVRAQVDIICFHSNSALLVCVECVRVGCVRLFR